MAFAKKGTKSFKTLQAMLPEGIVSTQLCAGFKEGGKDTCSGDSGAAIHIDNPKNRKMTSAKYVIGLVGSGKVKCAQPNSPAVYTRIYPYLDWIESIVWPVDGGEADISEEETVTEGGSENGKQRIITDSPNTENNKSQGSTETLINTTEYPDTDKNIANKHHLDSIILAVLLLLLL